MVWFQVEPGASLPQNFDPFPHTFSPYFYSFSNSPKTFQIIPLTTPSQNNPQNCSPPPNFNPPKSF